jgi:calcineurin-like phosphoesterase family protein
VSSLFRSLAVARPSRALVAGLFSALTLTPMALEVRAQSARGSRSTDPNLKVAIIGDQGSGGNAQAVLRLIRDERADMVLHVGDFDYEDNPARWDANISTILGADFPYFGAIGNHDVDRWSGAGGYQAKLRERLQRIAGAECTGDLGVKSTCRYRGLFFILSGAGTMGSGHEAYIRQQLEADRSIWRIGAWHKNQQEMQVGGKKSEVGWGPYDACRDLGAIIATGHEHSYSRTKTLLDLRNPRVDPDWPNPDRLRVAPGATFAIVSGLGGRSIRPQQRCLSGCDEWAKIYTSDQGAQYGATFIEFHVNGDPNAARGYFKNIRGQIIDQFTITAGGRVTAAAGRAPTARTQESPPPIVRDVEEERDARSASPTPPATRRTSPPATRRTSPPVTREPSSPVERQPSANGCVVSRDRWQGAGLASQSATFSVAFDMIPDRAPINAITGLSLGRADDFDDLAVAVRFNPEGVIDARNGSRFAARTSVAYEPGARYRVRMVVRMLQRTYDVYVTPPEGPERALALGYGFRSEQAGVSALNHWAVFARDGSHQVCAFSGP